MDSQTYIATGQEAAPEGSIRNDGDSQFATGVEEIDLGIFDVEGEWGVLDLNGRDRVDCMRASEGGSRDLREA